MREHRHTGLLSTLESPGDDTLSWLTYAARTMLPGVDYVSISIARSEGDLTTVGSTDPLAVRADELQYELKEGPCFDASSGAPCAHTDEVESDSRWTLYGPAAGRLGIRAQAALRLRRAGATIGSLNLYSTRSGSLDDDVMARARTLATQAADALAYSPFEPLTVALS